MKLNFLYKIIILLVLILGIAACTDKENVVDYQIQPTEANGYYLNAVLDSNRWVHPRSEPLDIVLNGVYYFSDCLLGDYYTQQVEGRRLGDVEIILPIEGALNPNCPFQENLTGVEVQMGVDDFPSGDTLVLMGESDYLRNDSMEIIGDRQGLIPLDTITLRWGEIQEQTLVFETDSFANIKEPFSVKRLERVLVKDSVSQYYLKKYSSTCSLSNINLNCTPVLDTTWSIRYSPRDTLNDTSFVQVQRDTVEWLIGYRCDNYSSYCSDVEVTDSLSFVPDTSLSIQAYQTWFIEEVNRCAEFAFIKKTQSKSSRESESNIPPLSKFEFERELLIIDQSQDSCRNKNHYFAYSIEDDSLIFDQGQLEALWESP